MRGPLDGIRVIEISMFQQGPVAGARLGDLGADVIKIEPCSGDPGTKRRPGRKRAEQSDLRSSHAQHAPDEARQIGGDRRSCGDGNKEVTAAKGPRDDDTGKLTLDEPGQYAPGNHVHKLVVVVPPRKKRQVPNGK